MEALEISIEVPLQVEQEPLVVLELRAQPELIQRALGRTILTGEEARLAQFANLTANVRPNRRPSFVR